MWSKLRRAAAFIIAVSFVLSGCSEGRGETGSTASPSSSVSTVSGNAASESAAQSVSWDSGAMWDPLCTIYCYGDLFETIISRHLDGYAEVSAETSGDGSFTEVHAKCSGGRICWYIFSDGGDAYIKALDQALVGTTESLERSAPDIYMVPGNALSKYTSGENGVAMDMDSMGISSRERGSMFSFTETMGENEAGEVCAVTWDVPVGAFVYRRSAAKEVFGSDDPVKVQAQLGDRDHFLSAAENLKKAGFMIYADPSSGYDAYMAPSTASWTDEDAMIRIDPEALSWAEDTRALYAAGNIGDDVTGTDGWKDSFLTEGKIFGAFLTEAEITEYFGKNALFTEEDLEHIWTVNSDAASEKTGREQEADSGESAAAAGGSDSWRNNEEENESSAGAAEGAADADSENDLPAESGGSLRGGDPGDWAICRGPAAYAAGGDWLLAGPDTEAKALVRKILRLAVCDTDVAKEICGIRGGMVNNADLMQNMKAIRSQAFGGQQASGLMTSLAAGLEVRNETDTDSGLKDIFRQDFLGYIRGEADKTACIERFYTDALDAFPDLLTG